MKMRLLILFIIILALLGVGIIFLLNQKSSVNSKLYVAEEGSGSIAVIDTDAKKILHRIDLSVEHDGAKMMYTPHNVQVASDNKSVWVTANAGGHDGHSKGMVSSVFAHGEESASIGMSDQVIIIDSQTDTIIRRIPIAVGVHLAHVVLDPASEFAYITGQKINRVYKINARTYVIEREILFSEKSEPHGLRISPDGKNAYVALLGGKGLGIINLTDDKVTTVALDGAAVQTGVTPDGEFVVVSLYDTKQLALYRLADQTISYIKLPENAKGPIQMYPTSDSRFIYLADQGYYFDQPANDKVYKIDLTQGVVVKEIKAGNAPHGVMVSFNGAFVYVTNLLSNDLSVIDTATDIEIARIPLGKEPNGVSLWTRP